MGSFYYRTNQDEFEAAFGGLTATQAAKAAPTHGGKDDDCLLQRD